MTQHWSSDSQNQNPWIFTQPLCHPYLPTWSARFWQTTFKNCLLVPVSHSQETEKQQRKIKQRNIEPQFCEHQTVQTEKEETIPILEWPNSVFVLSMMILSLCTKSVRFWKPLTWQSWGRCPALFNLWLREQDNSSAQRKNVNPHPCRGVPLNVQSVGRVPHTFLDPGKRLRVMFMPCHGLCMANKGNE